MLRRYRLEAGLSQEALAERTGLSVDAVGLHERGERRRPHAHTVHRYAEALNLAAGQREMLEAAARSSPRLRVVALDDAGEALAARPIEPTYPLTAALPLIGREALMQEVRAALPREGAHGSLRFLLLGGEMGGGKTRVLAETALLARAAGALVLAGGCYEQEGRLAYGPFHDALLDYVRAQPPAVMRQQLGDLFPELARILPELRERAPDVPEARAGEAEEHRLRLFWSVGKMLERLSQQQPVVLILDDLHWADDASLQLIHFLLRQPGLHRLLMVGAYRLEETGDVAMRFASTTTAGQIRLLSVQPLSEAEIETLLAARAGEYCAPELADQIFARSAGNPFFALETLGVLQEEGLLSSGDSGLRLMAGSAIRLPAAVQDAVGRRVLGLSPETREALELGAVLGREFGYDALERLWEGSRRDLFAALDAALEARILEETEAGYAFRHPVLREVIHQRMHARRRAGLHEQAGLALEALHGDQASEHAAELAHHFVAAGHRQDERASRYLLLAGEAARLAYSWDEALRLYQLGLERAHDAVLRAQLLEQRGAVQRTLGLFRDAVASLEESCRIYQSLDDLENEGRLTAYIADIEFLTGSKGSAADRIPSLTARLEKAGPSRALAALYGTQSRIAYAYADPRASAIDQIFLVARAAGDNGLLSLAEARRTLILIREGRIDEANAAAEELLRIAFWDRYDAALELGLGVAGELLKLSGDFEQALRWRERSFNYARRVVDPLWLMTTGASMGEILVLMGRWDEARGYIEQARRTSEELWTSWYSPFAHLAFAQLLLAEGSLPAASRVIESCLQVAQENGFGNWVHNCERLLVRRDLLTGHPEDALRRLERLQAVEGGEGQPGTLHLLAWAQLESGHPASAEETARGCIALAAAQRNRLDELAATLVLGRSLTDQSRWEEAEQVLGEALHLARSMPYPHAEARVLRALGEMSMGRGNGRGGVEHLEVALDIFRRLGASLDIEGVEGLLANQHA